MVIDPVARRTDGESVRIAKDVLSAGSRAKICLPDTPEEFARALSRRGSRRPVVVGDDHALLRAVAQLHRERELAAGVLSLIPVGAAHALEVAHALGVPRGAVAAARTALDGAVRRLDLLVDDSDGVVLGRLCIPAPTLLADAPHTGVTAVWDTCRSLMTSLVRPAAPGASGGPQGTYRLRVEADGVLLSDLDAPVRGSRSTPRATGASPTWSSAPRTARRSRRRPRPSPSPARTSATGPTYRPAARSGPGRGPCGRVPGG